MSDQQRYVAIRDGVLKPSRPITAASCTVYLRLNEEKSLPALYGPSADEGRVSIRKAESPMHSSGAA